MKSLMKFSTSFLIALAVNTLLTRPDQLSSHTIVVSYRSRSECNSNVKVIVLVENELVSFIFYMLDINFDILGILISICELCKCLIR